MCRSVLALCLVTLGPATLEGQRARLLISIPELEARVLEEVKVAISDVATISTNPLLNSARAKPGDPGEAGPDV